MSQEVETLTPQEEATEQTFDAGSEDEAISALAKRSAEAEQSAGEPDDEPKDEADEEPGDGEAEEADEPEDELVEVKSKNGKPYKVPREIAEGQLRLAEFSRKMNETAAEKKAYTERIQLVEGIEELAEKRADALADIKNLDKQIKQYEGIDWAKARAENPGQAAMAAVELLTLRDQRKDATNAAAQVARQITDSRNKLSAEKAGDMAKVLDKELPGWSAPGADSIGGRLTSYAMSKGWKPEELGAITDPRVVLALHEASKYAALQKSKVELKAKPKDVPPVVKPGARRPVNNAGTDAMSRFTKSKSDEDAIAALSSRRK